MIYVQAMIGGKKPNSAIFVNLSDNESDNERLISFRIRDALIPMVKLMHNRGETDVSYRLIRREAGKRDQVLVEDLFLYFSGSQLQNCLSGLKEIVLR